MSCLLFLMRFCCSRYSGWPHLWSVVLQPVAKNLLSALIISPSKKKKCVVSCSVCRVLFGARTSHREFSSQIPAWQSCLSLLLTRIVLHQIQSMPPGVLWSQHAQTKSPLICMFVGIGLCCAVALAKTLVSAGIKVAPLGTRQRQDREQKIQKLLRRGA